MPVTPAPLRVDLLKHPLAQVLLWSLCAHAPAFAQAPAPDAGTLLRDARPPSVPSAPRPAPPVDLGAGRDPQLPASAPFEVKTIRLTGHTAFDTETLHALVRDQEGRRLTLPELGDVAARITRHYQRHGYPLARAIVPAQKIAGGEVTIQIVEARFGAIRLRNGSPVRDALLQATASALQPGQPVTDAALDRALLLLSDIPQVAVTSVIQPGAAVGTSDLEIEATRNPMPWATLSLDNYGNRYVGRARVGAAASIANLAGHGDVLNLGAVATGKDMHYLSAGYEAVLNGQGTRAGLSYSQVEYELGRNLRALDAHGQADVASAWARQPLLRGRDANVYLQLQYDGKKLKDHIGGDGGSNNHRRLDAGIVSLNGDVRDAWLSGGVTSWSLGWTTGGLRFDDAAAEAADEASARTRGHFSKWNLNASRLQRVADGSALYLAGAAQGARDNLDSAEKMTVGGPFSVRAYDIGVLSGDTGRSATLEFRQELGAFANGPLQAAVFVDTARIRFNRRPWADGPDHATLSGAGVGLNWSHPDLWKVSLSVATRIGGTPALLQDPASARAWAAVSRAF